MPQLSDRTPLRLKKSSGSPSAQTNARQPAAARNTCRDVTSPSRSCGVVTTAPSTASTPERSSPQVLRRLQAIWSGIAATRARHQRPHEKRGSRPTRPRAKRAGTKVAVTDHGRQSRNQVLKRLWVTGSWNAWSWSTPSTARSASWRPRACRGSPSWRRRP